VGRNVIDVRCTANVIIKIVPIIIGGLTEVQKRALSETDAKQFLRWLITENISAEIRREMIDYARVIVDKGKLIHLSRVTSFVVSGKFPMRGSFPDTALPLGVNRGFETPELQSLSILFS
jgi:Protein of unknown function (DUF3684)